MVATKVAAMVATLCVVLLGSGPYAQEMPSASPSDSIAVARSLMRERRLEVAETLVRRLLARAEREQGPKSTEVAELLDLLIESLWRSRGRAAAAEARPLLDRAVGLKQELYGPASLELARSLFNLGVIETMTGALTEAGRVFREVLSIREAELPPGHEETLETLNALANVMWVAEDYAASVEIYLRATRLADAAGIPFSPAATSIRGNLGGIYVQLGRFEEARTLLEPQIAYYDSTDHPDLSGALNAMANIEMSTGEYLRAAGLYRRALDLEESRAGPLSPWAMNIRGNTAVALVRLGEYGQARELLERQVELLGSAGRRDPDLGTTYGRMAHIASELGDYQEELALRQEGLSILEETLPPGSARIAEALYNLGTVQGHLGRLDEQETLVHQAQAIWVPLKGPRHEFLAECHLALGSIARKRGDLDGARGQAEEALRIVEEASGPDSPRAATVLSTLGDLAFAEGRFDEARVLLEQAHTILAGRIGTDHPLTAVQQVALARLEEAAGRPDAALEWALSAERILTPHLRLTLSALPERQALLFAGERRGVVDVLLSLLDTTADRESTARVWDAVIRTRALVFDELGTRTHRAGQAASGGVWPADGPSSSLSDYRQAATRLANLIVGGPRDLNPEIYREQLGGARRGMEEAERRLAEWDSARSASREEIGLPDVVAALPAGSALVAYVRYERAGAGGADASAARYRAFVLDGETWLPVTVDLGDAGGIDALIEDWRAGVSRAAAGSGSSEQETGRILRRLLWDPLASYLAGATRVLIVPDDRIHLINLAALPLETGGFLIESQPVLHLLTAEREIAEVAVPAPAGQGALVFGDPDFDARPAAGPTGRTADRAAAALGFPEPLRGRRPDCLDLESLRFTALSASRKEAREVAESWRRWCGEAADREAGTAAVLLTGRDASESAFRRLASGRRLLHLATHGFMLDAACFQEPGAGGQAEGGARGGPEDAVRGPRAEVSLAANPLLFSGLALAGANRRVEAEAGEDDGILTAQEIAALDLAGVQWAILSACDSRGRDILDDEGVFGLQRAFRIAGARTVIASLWPVGDESARAWMRAFYSASLEHGFDTATAVREAGLAVLRERRSRGEDTHPFHWGAFVASGDWR